MEPARPLDILVLCTGNICRSPMADLLLNQAVSHEALAPKVRVHSAGTHGWEGSPVPELSVQVMRKHGLDIRPFVARRLTVEMVRQADLVLGMEAYHLHFAADMAHMPLAHEEERFRLWRSFDPVSPSLEVDDPYGGDYSIYEETYLQIRPAVPGIVSEIRRLLAVRSL